jgi:hypothetical protein
MEDNRRVNQQLDIINRNKSLLDEFTRNTMELEKYIELNKKLKTHVNDFIQNYYTKEDQCKFKI